MNWLRLNSDEIDGSCVGQSVIALCCMEHLLYDSDEIVSCFACPCGCGTLIGCFVGEIWGYDDDYLDIEGASVPIEHSSIIVTGLNTRALVTLVTIAGNQICNKENPFVRLLALGLWHEMVNGIFDQELRKISLITSDFVDDEDLVENNSVIVGWSG